jgi:hypothetical protein
MKLSKETLKVLKNFSTINPSIYIRKGSLLATKSMTGNILAEAVIEEEFPVTFAIYGLNEFLGTLKLFSDPVLDFSQAENNYMYIYEQDDPAYKVRYTFSDERKITYPKRRPLIESTDVSFTLDDQTLASIQKASSVMQLENMVITPHGDKNILIEVCNLKNPSSHKFSVELASERNPDADFKFIVNMDTLKILPASYMVSTTGNTIISFESDQAVDYYIGLGIQSYYKVGTE